MLGTSRLLNTITEFASSGGLGEAASWACLRQDIYVSLTDSKPLKIHLANYETSRSFYESDDEHWANRMVYIFANILNAAFQPNIRLTPQAWDQLEGETEVWNSTRPWTFTPLLDATALSEVEGPFPALWMLRAPHVVGNQ